TRRRLAFRFMSNHGSEEWRNYEPPPPISNHNVDDDDGDWDEGDALAYVLSASGLGHFRVDLHSGQVWMSEGSQRHFGIDRPEEVLTIADVRALVHPD